MTKRQFNTWMKRMGFTPTRAAVALGLHRNTIHNYMRGKHAGTDERSRIPKAVGLACAWLASPQGRRQVAHLSTRGELGSP
jgi:plasmid maintenance system antidote protein VapI